MAMIEIERDPSRRQLLWFGAALVLLFGAVGGLAWWRFGRPGTARILWGIGLATGLLFYAIPPIRRPLYLGWMYAAFPIGWTVSQVALALTYYLVVTPVGLVMRLCGRDPMRRRFDPGARTYWVEHRSAGDPGRYFRQF